ncbi:hypothetical protein IMZ08_17300 [Bacillus luteolus]|uniref:Uncharacterized protein n=1 Tax=Litchfieldia luteola TaxID=682179 RepID=A0ABR9QMR3_9BACI|nr:hypothetical protein [Cytobacillus luteolus]MBE4909793.1 hypothetical protein [Cytobacillus luteolus]MBP1942664.1 hypothetical protein [Cytobacillus luteolus]
MNYFLKLNVVSAMYAIVVFIPLELMFNVYRISRVTGFDIDTVNAFNIITTIVCFMAGSLGLIYLSKHWMKGRKANYFTVILWFPYFALFVYVFVSFFPITYGGDTPNPVTGLLAIGSLITHPMYIYLINRISVKTPGKA